MIRADAAAAAAIQLQTIPETKQAESLPEDWAKFGNSFPMQHLNEDIEKDPKAQRQGSSEEALSLQSNKEKNASTVTGNKES